MSKDGININTAPINFTRPLKPPGITKRIKPVSNWIKPSELPKKFHKDVWITKKYFHDSEPVKPFIAVVQNHYRGTTPEMSNGESWEFISDNNFRIMLLDRPDSTAAFNFGGFLCVMTVATWWFAIWALKGWYQEKKTK